MRQPVLTVIWVLFGLLLSGMAAAHSAAVDVTDGWQYRWGDSPFNEQGKPLWAEEQQPQAWADIGFPSNPPDRGDYTNVWYRVTLPGGDWNDPVLYIYSVDLIVEVYFQGEQIYHYGTFDANGQGKFEGWPWHAIDLPPNFAGQPLYFRVFSDYSDIGLWGEVQILDREDLYVSIIKNSIESLVVAGFSGLIALLALVFALVQSERRSFATVALFSFSVGAMLVAESQAGLLILYAPLFWDYIAAGSYFMIPVAMALLLSQWLTNTRPMVMDWIWKLHLVYVLAALGAALAGLVNLSETFPVFDAMFAVTTGILFVSVLRRWRTVNTEQRLVIAGYAVLAVLLMIDMAVAHSLLPWGRVPVNLGALAFSLAIVAISLAHYGRTQQAIRQLNQSLEHKVSERTERLEQLARQEQVRSRQLMLENERTGYLNDLIAELQDCRNLKEGYAIWAKRLPRLCGPLRGQAYVRLEQDAGFMRIAQWGSPMDEMALAAETLVSVPPPSQLGAAAGDALNYPWCFHLCLHNQDGGRFVAGLVLLEEPLAPGDGDADYNSAQLFLSLEQAMQKTSITLSTLGLRQELERLSYEDSLTGLKNRRFFEELLNHEVASARRSELPLSLLIIDIDLFKRFNDRYGHPAGDAALKAVAKVLMDGVRDSDVVCRLGGEEFVVLMPGSSNHPTLDRAELLRRSVSELTLDYDGSVLETLTISVGVATWPETTEAIDQLFQVADQALYRAKQNGRNCVSAA
ncbi:diguanylate cyclase [Marinobacter zhejiangensis]|uniref:diguanylate cyclase n=1 Tax=Marinobacter zhejiangensis TaxID=488535 RepID=A0A1I4MA31_9GAMM|nr:diguanylate cyclase [Marinobacter zhejiangensis]SFM00058.1 diguanylate cyclase (GGDEF) domain-containing protein [Marinobacter zhejiangensis]